jgi:F0F1-type ATP synthase assembly protein I
MMKIILGVVIGGIVGFGISYLVKCTSGACPLTSNPIISTIIGAVLGAMVAAGL